MRRTLSVFPPHTHAYLWFFSTPLQPFSTSTYSSTPHPHPFFTDINTHNPLSGPVRNSEGRGIVCSWTLFGWVHTSRLIELNYPTNVGVNIVSKEWLHPGKIEGDHTLGDYYLIAIRACERKKIEEKNNICAFDFTCKAIVKCERVEMPGSYL